MAHFRFVSTMGSAPWGGSEELWAGAAERLLAAGHRVTAHVFAWPEDAPKIAALEKLGATIRRRGRSSPLWRRALLKAAGHPTASTPFARQDTQPTDLVVISQGFTLDGLDAMRECRRRAWPYAPVVQANGEFFWPDDRGAREIRECYGASRNNFFVSAANRRMLCEQLAADVRGDVVSNPFTVPLDPRIAPPRDDGILRLACVARLDPVAKGQDVLINVLSREKWRSRPVDIGFFGTGRCESLVKELAARLKLERATFHGYVEDIEGVWAEHHALVLPSRMEGTPLALIEAMLCSRTAVVTDVGGNAELIEDGVSGFVAAAPVPDLLDDALERLWRRRGDVGALGEAARRRVLAVVPRDPIGDFAGRLLALVGA